MSSQQFSTEYRAFLAEVTRQVAADALDHDELRRLYMEALPAASQLRANPWDTLQRVVDELIAVEVEGAGGAGFAVLGALAPSVEDMPTVEVD